MNRYTFDGEPTTLEDFLAINAAPDVCPLDDEEIALARALKPGEKMHFGGGAMADSVLACHHGMYLYALGDIAACTFEVLVAHNDFTDEEVEAIRALKPGESLSTLTCEYDFRAMADDAECEFWARIVELLPECKTGDFPPEATFAFSEACREAVKTWHYWNKPIEDDVDGPSEDEEV